MGILSWIVVGLIAGWLATAIMPGDRGGLLRDMLVGIVGAIVGGWLFSSLGYGGPSGINLWSIFVAFVGSVVMLAVVRALTGRTV